MPEYLTPDEAATRLKVTRRTIYNRIKDGTLPAVKFGALWRIPSDELEQRFRQPGGNAPDRDHPAGNNRP